MAGTDGDGMKKFTLWLAYAVLAIVVLAPFSAVAAVEGWPFVIYMSVFMVPAAAAIWRIGRR
jgi:hypothetical protein